MFKHRFLSRFFLAALLTAAPAGAALAEDGGAGWFSGDWYLTLGASGFRAPRFEGDNDYLLGVSPIISIGRAGPAARFVSRNDSASFSLIDNGGFRAGLAGKLIFGRSDSASKDLTGIDPVRFGGEVGVFGEVYPSDWLRIRGEVRHGIRSHSGVVADFSADAFYDVTPAVRLSAGPRVSFASASYFDAFYGINATEAAASGVAAYKPGGGTRAVGIGGAIDWKATDKLTTSVFTEYSRLMGPAAKSSLVQQRGSRNQLLIGVSASYRFDFSL